MPRPVHSPANAPPIGGTRIAWEVVPESVQTAIAEILGSPVVTAGNQLGGFSPGLAARVTCADGSRAFVKAVGTEIDRFAPELYRRERVIAAQLPAAVPSPRLRGSYDDGDWVALVFDEVDGRMPHLPWRTDELRAVIAAVTELSTNLSPCPIAGLKTGASALHDEMSRYAELTGNPPDDLDPWEQRHLDTLAELALGTLAHLGGDTLVHFDIRADNILLGRDGSVWFVDWPWAFRGAAWLDSTLFLVNAARHGHDPEPLLAENPLLTGVDPMHVTGFLAGLSGYLADASRRPAPPALPTIREFQRANHDVTLQWVRRRLAWE